MAIVGVSSLVHFVVVLRIRGEENTSMESELDVVHFSLVNIPGISISKLGIFSQIGQKVSQLLRIMV